MTRERGYPLIYGRLDPAHSPSVTATNVDPDALRAVFPGF